MELLISANMIDAATALQYGLVNHVFEPEQLLAETYKILANINSKAPLAIGACISALNAGYDEARDGYAVEIDAFGFCFATDDMQEGTQAFIEKRKAVFSGK
jgi:enoyl-CoA hydratase